MLAAAERPSERGVSLVALTVAITLMMIAMAIMLPAWSYVAKNERELELLFRAEQIARAIEKYKLKHGNRGYPPTLEALVKGRYLRKLYKDPMVPDGEWRLMRPNEPPVPLEDLRAAGGRWARRGRTIGPIAGVASRHSGESLRHFNSRRRYNEWFFIENKPRVVGKLKRLPPGVRPGRSPTPKPR